MSVEVTHRDPDLAAIVLRWQTLPEPIRAAIRALIGTVGRDADG